MQNAGGHFLILAGAAVAAGALSLFVGMPGQVASTDESAAVVVTVPSRPREPAARVPAGEPPRPVAPPADRVSLARELQRELTRVGCYDGEISGVWSPSSRAAMKRFIDQVNAKLPISQPDDILLRLVQGHRQKACDAPCPADQPRAGDGRCVPGAIAADAGAARKPQPHDPRPSRPDPGETKPEQGPALASEQPRVAALAPKPDRADEPPPSGEPPPGPARLDAPVPPVGVYEKRSRSRTQSQPPKFVRSLVRTVQRTLAPWLP